jgi:superfamily I DNA/RNA helicase
MGKNVKVYRKGSVDVLKPLIDKEYNIQELIDMGFILPEVKQYDSFSQVLTDKDLLPKVPYIIKVIKNGFDTEKMPRVQLDSIHKVKGLTFDNIIVDLTTYRDERNKDEERRIAYVAYSRGRKDCWTIGTSNFKFKNNLAGIQNNRNYYLYGEKNNDTQRYV